MTSDANFPPLDGSLTAIIGMLDWQAEHNPSVPCVIWPSTDSPTGTKSITNAEYAEATHRIARILRAGGQIGDGDVVSILIHTDTLLYCALMAGCIRAGLVPFPMSPRNSGPGVCSMMEKTSAHHIIADSSTKQLITEVQAELLSKNHDLHIIELPGLFDAFPCLAPNRAEGESLPYEPYPYKQPESLDEVGMILHSSGSTGFPKPIRLRHQYMLDVLHSAPVMGSRERGIRWFGGALPSFHAYAWAWQFVMPWASGNPGGHFAPQYPAPPVVPNPENTLEASRITGCNAIPGVPAFVEAWSRSDDALEYLKTLDCLIFAGGPLSKKCGDDLAMAGVKISSMYAGTEFGGASIPFYPEKPTPEDDRTPLDWEWLKFNPRYKPRWIPQGDGSYELQLMSCATHRPAIENVEDAPGYATSDLFVPHPTRDLWKLTGRADDVIVLKTAEKVVPLAQEGHILSSPIVRGAIMFGRGRDQAGILIEPTDENLVDSSSEQALVAFRNRIWPVVDEANRNAPAFARIFKEMIIVTDPARPFPRAPKGTVLKKQVMALYEDKINQLYETVENSTNMKDTKPPSSWDIPDLQSWLLEVSSSINDGQSVHPTLDLFQQGFDRYYLIVSLRPELIIELSLSATFLRTRIVAALRISKQFDAAKHVSQNFIFDYPTLDRLANAIHDLVHPEPSSKSTPSGLQQTRDMISKYTANMPQARSKTRVTEWGAIVLLTGSTGNLGTHILASLLADDHVSKVYTLDRPGSDVQGMGRLASAFADRGLPVDLLSKSKLSPLTGSLDLPNFGLPQEVYDELAGSITDVVHNAWAIHFSHGLSFFEGLISGTRKLIDLALSLDRSVRVIFTSSIATAQSWNPTDGPVPEDFLPDNGINPDTGYAASKYVVEHIFAEARAHGLDAICLRVGQLCGPEDTGAWNVTDWVPILFKTSIALGAYPDASGPVNWIPMDAVAGAILDLVLSKDDPAGMLNVVHPRPISWRETFDAANVALGLSLPFIPFADWVAQVEARSADASQQTLESMPAIKLLNFFNGIAKRNKTGNSEKIEVDSVGLAILDTTKLQHYSTTIRNLQPLGPKHVQSWIAYWRTKRFLQ
ncbi:hypothetical protein BC835DRAFT_1413297 [Cytidiella melzeri]|nr:hypothetical protein BC835DRAFT_1413297 [Cytidiella melzeri]